MVAYTFYEYDNRVRRYAETLVKRGDTVDVFALQRVGQYKYELFNGVNVYRIQKRVFNEKKVKMAYLYRLIKFLIISSFFFTIKHLKNSYNLVHIHSVPDFEVFAAWIVKFTRSKIILDIHDLVPEFYLSKFNVRKESFFYKLLIFLEKASIAFSDHVIISNHLWKKTLISRSVVENKCTAILNYPDTSIFYVRPKKKINKKFIILYPGTINRHQGLDIAVEAFSIIKDKMPDAEFHIFGEGPEKINIGNLIKKFGLKDRVSLMSSLPLDSIVDVMANSDLGIVPKRSDSFGNEAFSTKILEFMALGVPVLVSDTKIDKFYYNDDLVMFFRSGNVHDMAEKMLYLYNNQGNRDRLVKNSLEYIKQNVWDTRKNEYLYIVDSLTNNR